MCGIFGIVEKNPSNSPNRHLLNQMGKSLSLRGPDNQGIFIHGQAGLGATRLSIIDLSGGNQPLFNEDKSICVVQNGELYNYQTLTTKLQKKAHRFSSKSDTEVYAHMYEEYGLKFVDKLQGMYALALWDKKQRQLILVRDRLGIKPLYYAQTNNHFVFASEIKALLQTNIKRQLNKQSLYDYLSVNYIPGPLSIFQNIKKLPPGHTLIFKNKKSRIYQYWQPSRLSGPIYREKSDIKSTLLDLLKKSIKNHLISDVPIGTFLSGGIDSSAVVALASQHTSHLKTFSVGFEQKSYNELKYAKKVAKLFGTKHEEIKLKLKPQDLIEKIATYFDEPFADSSAIAVYSISEAVHKKNIKVVLSGDGGDEIFGGYVTYQADQLLQVYNHLPQFIRKKIIPTIIKHLPTSHAKMAFDFKAKRFIRGAQEDPLVSHFLWKAIFTNKQIQKLTLNNFQSSRSTIRLWEKIYNSINSNDTLNKLIATDMQTSLVDDMLTKVDRMSMVNSVEVRLPLLDHKLVEFMLKLPSKYKVRGLSLKWLLKKTLQNILPKQILHRPKAGFHVPVSHWIKHELKDIIGDYLSSSAIKKQACFNPKFVQKLLKNHKQKKADYSREIWGILMFSIWHKKHLT